ncbi:hypothetical protein BDZ97DRAFT_1799865 [Flammula alnicola]|nr:hypothetical protein BDZ97DRAFT_1799865 [Flammula alnicola]
MSAISDFPIELLKFIASDLPTIHDVLSFCLVSHNFHDSVHCDQFVFRVLFLRTYDPPREPHEYDYTTSFRRRHTNAHEEDVLRDMILDARPVRDPPLSIATSPNIVHLSRILANRDTPPELEGLLFPLQFLPNISMNTSKDIPRGSSLEFQSNAFQPSILREYLNRTDEIAKQFAEQLDPQSQERFSVFGAQARSHLEPYEFPNFWEGDGRGPVPKRWYGGYFHCMPFPTWTQRLRLIDMKLKFSPQGVFSSSGADVAQFTISRGKIGAVGADGRRRVNWLKDYGTYHWRYEGVMEYGNQRIIGVWGSPGPNETLLGWNGYGIFMFWAVPEDAPDLAGRG